MSQCFLGIMWHHLVKSDSMTNTHVLCLYCTWACRNLEDLISWHQRLVSPSNYCCCAAVPRAALGPHSPPAPGATICAGNSEWIFVSSEQNASRIVSCFNWQVVSLPFICEPAASCPICMQDHTSEGATLYLASTLLNKLEDGVYGSEEYVNTFAQYRRSVHYEYGFFSVVWSDGRSIPVALPFLSHSG